MIISEIFWYGWVKDQYYVTRKEYCILSFGWIRSVWILRADISEHSVCCVLLHLWRWNRRSVVKHRHINFRCRGFTQKKEYNKKRVTTICRLLWTWSWNKIVMSWTYALMRRLAGECRILMWKSFAVLLNIRLRWSKGSMLAFGTQVCGFEPSRSCRIFKDEKILSTPLEGK